MSLFFAAADSGDMLLASGSQDNYIRVWRVSSQNKLADEDTVTDELRLKEDCFSVTSQGLISLCVLTVLNTLAAPVLPSNFTGLRKCPATLC